MFKKINKFILIIPILYNKSKITSSVRIKESFKSVKFLYIIATEVEEIAPEKKYKAII